MARDQFVRLFRVGRASISSIRSLSWASPLTIVTDVERSGHCFDFSHKAQRLTTALPVDRKEERPTLVKSDDAAVDTTTKTTRTNRRGDRRGIVSYEKQVAIHDPKYAEQRKEWARKAGVVIYEKQVGRDSRPKIC
jgi:tRNA uridine 5-carbamoylmethylation protein Kti12